MVNEIKILLIGNKARESNRSSESLSPTRFKSGITALEMYSDKSDAKIILTIP